MYYNDNYEHCREETEMEMELSSTLSLPRAASTGKSFSDLHSDIFLIQFLH